ncbi:XdhC family protein [Georgenia yuyongxinii]|uniref:XdhC family protein n=1 Tax=Georgenia yuyongxinii TaxID=2589797 RepID=A0A552WUZ3_9MICO|nr:XdhC/CoxI family protein [Georgenia yuyongxinii]TRW46567.1 XdhC family protein [Georgenia yuyongxinii]
MRDILESIRSWTAPFAVATVVRTWKSSPRGPGAAMAVNADGEAVGSVSGGCVEGAVYEVCREVLESGEPQRVKYGVSDDDAFEVGLTCGGTIELFVQRLDPAAPDHLADLVAAVDAKRPTALATVAAAQEAGLIGRHVLLVDGVARGGTGDERLDAAIVDVASGLLEHGRNQMVHLGTHGERRMDELSVFVESFAPAPRMVVFGAIDFAAAVARIGSFLGYHVTVCDARPVFATRARFPEVDEIVVQWPHEYLQSIDVDERTVLCVLTHDPKFDIPLLVEALHGPAAYIGVMGSRRTHADRNAQLLEQGITQEQLARLRSPIGLDLGAHTPEETAVSIAAEIVAQRWGGTGRPLRDVETPIHREPAAVTARS